MKAQVSRVLRRGASHTERRKRRKAASHRVRRQANEFRFSSSQRGWGKTTTCLLATWRFINQLKHVDTWVCTVPCFIKRVLEIGRRLITCERDRWTTVDNSVLVIARPSRSIAPLVKRSMMHDARQTLSVSPGGPCAETRIPARQSGPTRMGG